MKCKHFKRKTRYEFKFGYATKHTAHGGQVLVDALARRYSLWEKFATLQGIDPRKRKGSGFSPDSMVAQIIFTLTSGGTRLADCERLGADPVLLEAIGLDAVADQTNMGEWLRSQNEESVRLLWQLNSELVKDVLADVKPSRTRYGGKLEVFFDDAEIEVYGRKIEGARVNYKGELALSFQTLLIGPLLVDGLLGGFAEVAECQSELLGGHRGLCDGSPSHFHADSGSSAGRDLMDIRDGGFTTWSVSYNSVASEEPRLRLPDLGRVSRGFPGNGLGTFRRLFRMTKKTAWRTLPVFTNQPGQRFSRACRGEPPCHASNYCKVSTKAQSKSTRRRASCRRTG